MSSPHLHTALSVLSPIVRPRVGAVRLPVPLQSLRPLGLTLPEPSLMHRPPAERTQKARRRLPGGIGPLPVPIVPLVFALWLVPHQHVPS